MEDHGSAMAAGELKLGEGEIIIGQLDLNNRVRTNPVTYDFVFKLLSKK